MGEETITVGEISRGSDAGAPVELPVVDVLTGRSFITGKSGSGKSNSASVVCEKLLDEGYGILIVDIDGEYYGLKEEYEILHVGADNECDLQVGVEHASKIAELALEGNVPIILDVSSFLDESKARELLTEVTKQLFAKEKKLKQPFLMLVEEVHEYIPEGGGVDECGRMLIKVGKRGRKHGLGIVGISQRPADVKKDFITQCDWLVWHRLTWNNDTKVVGRVLGEEYADYIEEMNDGECFLMTDWAESIQPVQFERKRTFDAGATPGLDDFERPELKSVSSGLVEELQEISDETERRENRIEELQRELAKKDDRITDLERQLSDARDLKQMADRFSRAMMEQATGRPLSGSPGRQSELDEAADPVRPPEELRAELDAVRNGDREPASTPVPNAADTGVDVGEFDTESVGVGPGASDAGSEDASDSNSESTSEAVTDAAVTDESVDDDTDRSTVDGDVPPLVARLRREIDSLEEPALSMLRHYREYGPTTPVEAHAAAGGSGDRTAAYAANRQLRTRRLVEHVGRGNHDYALTALVSEECRDPFAESEPAEETVDPLVRTIEATFVDGVEPASFDADEAAPWPEP